MSQYSRNNPDDPFGNVPSILRQEYEAALRRRPYGNLQPQQEDITGETVDPETVDPETVDPETCARGYQSIIGWLCGG